jgi:hypothetical protein
VEAGEQQWAREGDGHAEAGEQRWAREGGRHVEAGEQRWREIKRQMTVII